MIRRLLSVLAVAAVASLWVPAAHATCGIPLLWGQVDYNCGGGVYFCYVVGPNPLPADGSYWALNFGDPATGLGDDNGTHPIGDWCRVYGSKCYMTGDWAGDERIDGCIDGKIPDSHSVEVMVTSFSDQAGGDGYFAVAAVERRIGQSTVEFDFTFCGGTTSPCAAAQDIVLQPIPPLTITNATCGAPGDCTTVNVDVQCGDLSGGFYSDGNVTASEVIQGCQVFKQVVTRGVTPPGDRSRDAGWVDTGVLVPQGSTATVTLNCSTDSDAYLAAAVAYEGGFVSGHVSANSTRIECGPNLAEPPDVKFKVVPRPDKPKVRPRMK